MALDNAVEQLMMLKELFATTGALHQAQAMQLEGWAKVAYKATSVELRLDIPTKICEFHLKLKPKAKVKSQNKKRLWILSGVKWLLGEHWTVKVFVGKKSL
jgi:hypothetical protein